MPDPTRGRFGAPSDGLNLRRLHRENRKVAWVSYALAATMAASVLGYFIAVKREKPAAKPLAMEFIIRKPLAKKSFRMRKAQVQKRVMTRRLVTSKPKLAHTPPREIRRADALGNVAVFAHQIDAGTSVGTGTVTPEIAAVQIRSSKDPEKRISMQEEFLDLNALDTGKYRGMVIQDPTDRRNIRGFVYLALAWGNDLQPDAPRSVSRLADGINAYTGIQAKVADHMFLDSPELFKTPFVYITDKDGFELTDKEIESLGRYMRSGGFILADNDRPDLNFGPAEASLRSMFGQALGRDGQAPEDPQQPSHLQQLLRPRRPPGGRRVPQRPGQSRHLLPQLRRGRPTSTTSPTRCSSSRGSSSTDVSWRSTPTWGTGASGRTSSKTSPN